jgi:two-component system, cell cycle sensor histidine kinase and response regulator CckA
MIASPMAKKTTRKSTGRKTAPSDTSRTELLASEGFGQESASILGTLINHSLVGIYIISGHRFTYVNPRLAEIFGYTVDEILAMENVSEVAAPEARSMVETNIQRRLEGAEESIRYSFEGIKKGGGRVVVEVFGSRAMVQGVPSVVGMLVDMSAQLVTESVQREQASAMRAAMDGMAILSKDGIYTYINEAHAKIYGYRSPADLIGKSWEVLYYENERRRINRDIFPILTSVGSWRGEAVGKRRDGTTFDQEISLSSIGDSGLVCVVRDITERRRAESELLKLRKAVDSAAEAIFMTDPDGIFTYANPGFQTLYGFAPSEVIGKATPRILKSGKHGPDDYNRLWNTLNKIGMFRGELVNRTRDGRLVDIETSVITIFDDRGTVTGFLAIQNDITERKRSERELRSLNRSLRTISECNEILVHATDERSLLNDLCNVIVRRGGYNLAWVGFRDQAGDGALVPVACAGDELGIFSIDEPWSGGHAVSGTHGTKGTSEEGGTHSFQKWQNELFNRGYNSVLGLPLQAADRGLGTLVICSIEPNSFNAREIQLLMELADDLAFGIVTLRTRREHSLAEMKISEQAALLDVATDAILVREIAGPILFWNKGAERLYGWSASEAVGADASILRAKEDEDKIRDVLDQVLLSGEWSGELNHVTKQGGSIIVESRWALLRDERGAPRSCLIVNTDITAKKRLESQFLRAQRMEGLGTLAGGIAHDLNNVLTPILMSVDILRGKFPDRDTMQVLNLVETTAKRGASMVQQVLTFARGVDGARGLIQPKHLLRELDKIVRETFPKTIRIKVDIAKNLGTVIGDITQLHQVFLNLCINARDAMPSGGQLSIKAENTILGDTASVLHISAKQGPYVVVTVSDTGAGIPADILQKIFEPFFTTKEPGKGTGLGLSTAETIIKSHGGFILVESQVGQGSMFRVYLPSEGQGQTSEPSRALPKLRSGNGETIMIVDDEISIREITREMLESYNYKTLVASDGVEALSLYTKHRDSIALIITDMLMPGMDGAATIRALRNLNPSARIVAVSGFTPDEQLPDSGADTFLSKPFTTEQLLSALSAILESR